MLFTFFRAAVPAALCEVVAKPRQERAAHKAVEGRPNQSDQAAQRRDIEILNPR
jgi:hypothetical protein